MSQKTWKIILSAIAAVIGLVLGTLGGDTVLPKRSTVKPVDAPRTSGVAPSATDSRPVQLELKFEKN